MKNLKKLLFVFMAVLVLALSCTTTAFAKAKPNYQESVVLIVSEVTFTSSNAGISFNTTATGTGFGVGKPGDAVQYIGTCYHVVQEPAGVYTVYLDADTYEMVAEPQKMEEGVRYPTQQMVKADGRDVIMLTDYFNTKTNNLKAIFSLSSSDYVDLTIAQLDQEHDMAICKLSGAPTDKIKALPLQKKEDIVPNTRILSVGYPAVSRYADAEASFDSSSAVIQDGIVSSVQRTNGTFGSTTSFDAYEVSSNISGGMSGGPTINEETGAIIGVNAFLVSQEEQAVAARYAICIDYMTSLLDKENIPYEIYGGGLPVGLIIGCIAGVIVIAVIIIIAASAKKSTPAPAPAPNNGGTAPAAPAATVAQTPAASPRKYYLIGVAGPLAGKKFGVGERAIIGRDKTRCNVVFAENQPGVSALHCEIKVNGGVMTLKDCGSSYGTFLANGTKLTPNNPVVLQSGSTFWVGTKDIVFEVRY